MKKINGFSVQETGSGSSLFIILKSESRFYFSFRSLRRCCRYVPNIETDLEGFKDYLAFQFCLAGKTLFQKYLRTAARAYADRGAWWNQN
jgi:hypothetical protein